MKALSAPALIAALAALTACSQEPPPNAAPAAEAPAAAAPPATGADSMPHPVPAEAGSEVDLSGIAKAEGGQTVAEVYAGKDQLEGQTILVRGKVVKVNAGIMDRNWLHVRDGSGAEGTNDLTITTVDALPAIGDTVLVTGAVSLNRDFGMGYTYPVIVEDADVTVEAGVTQ
jgi:hypothetical protein